MPDKELVANHYAHGSLLASILDGIQKQGKTVDSVSVDDLAPVDEFHIGGRMATEDFLNQIRIDHDDHVLDVGCGTGGASRFAASQYGCRVTGIDLTEEYVTTGKTMCSWVGLGDRINLEEGDATAIPYSEHTFDKSYMMHVGMNIADKIWLVSELHRVLKPGGRLGIYDIMLVGDDDLMFPVPWAMTSEGSSVSSPEEYKAALKTAGFRVICERNRRRFALKFFSQLQAATGNSGAPPPLGLHILMGEDAPLKVQNMIENVSLNRVAPVELIAEKTA